MTDPSTGSGILYEALGPSKTLPGLLSAVEAPGITKVAHGPFDRLRDPRGCRGLGRMSPLALYFSDS